MFIGSHFGYSLHYPNFACAFKLRAVIMSLTSSIYWKDKLQRTSVRTKVSVLDPFIITCPFSRTASVDWESLQMPVVYSDPNPGRFGDIFETVHYPALDNALFAQKRLTTLKERRKLKKVAIREQRMAAAAARRAQITKRITTASRGPLRYENDIQSLPPNVKVVPTPYQIQREFEKYGMGPIGSWRGTRTNLRQDEWEVPSTAIKCTSKKVKRQNEIHNKLKSFVSLKSAYSKANGSKEPTSRWHRKSKHKSKSIANRHVRFTSTAVPDSQETSPLLLPNSSTSTTCVSSSFQGTIANDLTDTPLTTPDNADDRQGLPDLLMSMAALSLSDFHSHFELQRTAVEPGSTLKRLCRPEYNTEELDEAVLGYLVAKRRAEGNGTVL